MHNLFMPISLTQLEIVSTIRIRRGMQEQTYLPGVTIANIMILYIFFEHTLCLFGHVIIDSKPNDEALWPRHKIP